MEDDGDDKDDSKRRTRNLSEKKRRDQFNMLVNELSTMVSSNNRKMDKSTVLKSTITFLKNHNEITVRSRAHDIQEDWKPAFLSNEEFTYLVLEALEGFLMVFSATGRIYYVSESVTSLLGHNPADMVNQSIFDLMYEDDRPYLFSLLQNPAAAVDPLQNGKENEVRFQCHLRRGSLDFLEESTYELIQFNGHFRANMEHTEADDLGGFQPDPDARLLFVCTGRLHTPHLIRDVSLADASRSEFTSRHSLEWKFLFLDHRAPPIIGYLPFEVLGTSGYDYYHFDDLEKVVTCHEALMQKGELTSCYYRFLTKGQQWIWLQTRFYITYHQWNSKPEFVVCTHRVVSYADISKSVKRENVPGETAAVSSVATTTTAAAAAATAAALKEEENAPTLTMAHSSDEAISPSPSYKSEASDAFGNTYRPASQPASVNSVSAGSTCTTAGTAGTAAAWPSRTPLRFEYGSDTASVSGDSRGSHRNKSNETALVARHTITTTQYLQPAPYVGTVAPMAAHGVSEVLQVPVPVLVSPEQAQIEEQLQRKHEELQQMIVRQQEELREVKEQLLLARLGILPTVINEQPGYAVNAAPVPTSGTARTQFVYEPPTSRPAIAPYPQNNMPQ